MHVLISSWVKEIIYGENVMQNCMNLEKIVLEKLAQFRDERKITWLAEQTGISQPTLSRAAKGENDLGLSSVSKLIDFFNLSVVEPGVNPLEFYLVTKVEAQAGAGSSFVTSDKIKGMYAFRRDFFQTAGINADKCVMFDVIGQSMQPLIMDGDTILVDESQKDLKDGEIFLVSLGEELLVKRVQRTPRGWLLISHNPDYAPIPIEQCDLAAFVVHGRVRWFGRVV